MQVFILLGFCVAGLLLGPEVADADPLGTIAAQITQELTTIENNLVASCNTLTSADVSAGNALKAAIAATVQKNNGPGVTQAGAIVADVATAIQAYLVTSGQNYNAAAAVFTSANGQWGQFIGGTVNALAAAFQQAGFSQAQIAAWNNQQAPAWAAIGTTGDQQCANQVTQTKASLDGNDAAIQTILKGITGNPQLVSPLGQYVTAAIATIKATLDNAAGTLIEKEQVNALLVASISVI